MYSSIFYCMTLLAKMCTLSNSISSSFSYQCWAVYNNYWDSILFWRNADYHAIYRWMTEFRIINRQQAKKKVIFKIPFCIVNTVKRFKFRYTRITWWSSKLLICYYSVWHNDLSVLKGIFIYPLPAYNILLFSVSERYVKIFIVCVTSSSKIFTF